MITFWAPCANMRSVAYDYDLLVIGSGPAGEKGAAQAAYFGKRVLVVEKEQHPGGAAVHTGTLPSKTLRETALFLSGRREREVYGVSVTVDPAVAVPKLLSRKDAVRDLEVERIHWNLERHHIDYRIGEARLVGPHDVVIEGATGPANVSAAYILIATGSVPFHPSFIPFDDPDVDDSDSILLLDRMPQRLTVIGGGVIGCEYTSIFAALGVQVTLIEPRDELLSFLDADMSEALRLALVKQGVDVRLGETAESVARDGDDIVTTLGNGSRVISDKLLYAAGRGGAIGSLNLEAVGVAVNKRNYILVDGHFVSGVPSILAVGDVVGFPALASTSMEQGRVAVCHAFGFDYKKDVSALLPYGIYTIPEVSCVGLSEEDAKAAGISAVCGRAPYSLNARGKIIGDASGLVKLVFDRDSRKLLGAHCIGSLATELVHIGQTMIMLGGTVEVIIEQVFNYPTLAMCYKYAAYDALGNWKKAADGANT